MRCVRKTALFSSSSSKLDFFTSVPSLSWRTIVFKALETQTHKPFFQAGGVGGLASLIKSSDKFISAAVSTAVKQNFSGYNFDNELRGTSTDKSWAFLVRRTPFLGAFFI
jgi:hypothetical protein